MDEERREVMNILEGRPADYGSPRASLASMRTASPAPPVRSMLDIGPAATRHASIAGMGTGISSPTLRGAPLTGNMLDPYNFPPRSSQNNGTPPRESHSPAAGVHRTLSDASSKKFTRPRSGSSNSANLPYTKDQFDMSSTISGPALPKRVAQGGKKGISSMASIMQGQELDPMMMSRDRGRHNSTAGILGPKTSQSPSSRLNLRSDSPGTRKLNTNNFNPMPTPGKFLSDSGKVIDMRNAYRKLSDVNMMKSGSSLSRSQSTDQATRARLDSGESLSPTGEFRLEKDHYDEDGEDAIESSDDGRTSDEEAWGARGRGRSRRNKHSEGAEGDDSDVDGTRRPKGVRSLLAAAEEERW